MAYINEFRNIVKAESKGYGNRFFSLSLQVV